MAMGTVAALLIPFTLFTVASRPASANQMCILVANADHSVNQGTGNCVALPQPVTRNPNLFSENINNRELLLVIKFLPVNNM